jgi:DUF1365 family protein
MMYLDLDELPELFDSFWLWSSRRFNLAWFKRADHYGDPHYPLDQAIRDKVAEETGETPQGPIRLLTHLRYFGYGFNPVSFYYCFDRNDEYVEYIVAEVNNTPWGEQHCYVMTENQNHGKLTHKKYRFNKSFHVSPFMPMEIDYDWRFSNPEKQLTVHMNNNQGNKKLFDATLIMHRNPISHGQLARILLLYPMMTGKVISAIYYQALKLWLKGVPFHSHPATKEAPHAAKSK